MTTDPRGSRTFHTAVLLTVSGGWLDAYTYSARGGVFANAQTGNIVKLGIAAAQGDLHRMLSCLIPVIAFTFGILLSLIIESNLEKRKIPFIRRAVLLVEIGVLLIVMFLPQDELFNRIANALISFICAMQMEAFRTFEGQAFATLVSTGNLRKAIEYLYSGIRSAGSAKKKTGIRYLLIVALFITGAVLGTLVTDAFPRISLFGPVFLFVLSFIWITARWFRIRAGDFQ